MKTSWQKKSQRQIEEQGKNCKPYKNKKWKKNVSRSVYNKQIKRNRDIIWNLCMEEKMKILEINNMNNLRSKIDIIPNCRYVEEFILKKVQKKNRFKI